MILPAWLYDFIIYCHLHIICVACKKHDIYYHMKQDSFIITNIWTYKELNSMSSACIKQEIHRNANKIFLQHETRNDKIFQFSYITTAQFSYNIYSISLHQSKITVMSNDIWFFFFFPSLLYTNFNILKHECSINYI